MKTMTKKNLRALFEPLLLTLEKDKYLPQTEWTQVDYADGIIVLSKYICMDTYMATTIVPNQQIQPQHFFIKDHDIKEMLKVLDSSSEYNLFVSSFGLLVVSDNFEYAIPAITDFYNNIIISNYKISAVDVWDINEEFITGSSNLVYYLDKSLLNKLKSVREIREISNKDLPLYLSPAGASYWSDDTEAFIITDNVDDTFHRLNRYITDAIIKFSSLTTSDIKIELNKFDEYNNEVGLSVFDCFADGILLSSVTTVPVIEMRSPSYHVGDDYEIKPLLDDLKSCGITSRTSTKPFKLIDFNINEYTIRGGELFALLKNFPFETMKYYNCFKVFSMSQRNSEDFAYFKHTFKEYDG